MCFVVCLFVCLFVSVFVLIYTYVFCCLFVSVFVYRNHTGIKHWQLSDKDGTYYWGSSTSYDTLESFVEVRVCVCGRALWRYVCVWESFVEVRVCVGELCGGTCVCGRKRERRITGSRAGGKMERETQQTCIYTMPEVVFCMHSHWECF